MIASHPGDYISWRSDLICNQRPTPYKTGLLPNKFPVMGGSLSKIPVFTTEADFVKWADSKPITIPLVYIPLATEGDNKIIRKRLMKNYGNKQFSYCIARPGTGVFWVANIVADKSDWGLGRTFLYKDGKLCLF